MMSPAEIAELVGRYGLGDFQALVRSAGKKVSGSFCQCPLENCADKGPDSSLRAGIYKGNEALILKCHRCGESADYLKLYQVVKGLDFLAAVEQLRGATPATDSKKPQLALVRAPVLETNKEKLSPEKVRLAWRALALDDDGCRAYLEGRGLAELVGTEWLRFAVKNKEAKDALGKEINSKASSGFKVGMQLFDVAGQPRGIEFRNILELKKGDSKIRSLTGSAKKGTYFGRPGAILGSACVVVTEGMADTMAALLWTRDEKDLAVVGAPGTSGLPQLADALEDAGIEVAGRLFVLCSQRDAGEKGNQSLSAFMQLKAKLVTKGAHVVLTPDVAGEEKDLAKAWELEQLGEWPPPHVERYFAATAEQAADAGMVRVGKAAVWRPKTPIEPAYLGRDLETLTWLLFSESTRRNLVGLGEWRFNEMTDAVEYGGRKFTEDDITTLRVSLEQIKGSDGKKLKFSDTDVKQIVRNRATAAPYHPVREYLERLKAEGVDPFLDELPAAMHLDPEKNGLQCEYVRRWMIAAVARAFKPGCQADSMLVLFGGEGLFKSRFFEKLGGPWFVRTSDKLSSKDFIEALRRGWIVELDELDAMAKADFPEVLAVITRPTDYYSPKWVRENTDVPRHSVLGGSTNDGQFLPALTGDRRFHIVHITKPIDLAYVIENRDRLWAWAVKFYKAGEQHHLEPELDELRAADNKQYQAVHPWQTLVGDYLATRRGLAEEGVRTEDLLLDDKCIGLQRAQLNGAQGKLMGTILRNLGWAPAVVGKQRQRIWKPVKP